MNKDKKIERLEQKLAKAEERIKTLESKIRDAKKESSKKSKKKDVRTLTLSEEQERLLSDLLRDISSQN